MKENKDEKIYSKNQLWLHISKLICVILILIIIWLFTATTDKDFFSHFSFASTVTSVILSVIAIFMSITGESKSEILRDRIEKVADRLDNNMGKLSEKLDNILHNMDDLKFAKITEQPEKIEVSNPQYSMIGQQIQTSDHSNNAISNESNMLKS